MVNAIAGEFARMTKAYKKGIWSKDDYGKGIMSLAIKNQEDEDFLFELMESLHCEFESSGDGYFISLEDKIFDDLV